MKTLALFISGLLLLCCDTLPAQNKRIVTSGTIEFERTNNMFALVKKKVTATTPEVKSHYDDYLRTEPQFIKLKSTLSFANNITLFTPTPGKGIYHWYDSPMANQINTIYADLNNRVSIIKKDFSERTYLIKDTLRKIKWKMTDETRVIAGYTCRRANALVLDSVYVVAFYTDEIHVSGGPESFNGLPGMILGVAVPHENVTWFATKVTDTPIDPKTLAPPKEGKKMNNKEVYNDIMKTLGHKDEYSMFILRGLLL